MFPSCHVASFIQHMSRKYKCWSSQCSYVRTKPKRPNEH